MMNDISLDGLELVIVVVLASSGGSPSAADLTSRPPSRAAGVDGSKRRPLPPIGLVSGALVGAFPWRRSPCTRRLLRPKPEHLPNHC